MDQIVAIDPAALWLRGDIYVKIHLPRPVEISKLDAVVKSMTSAERKVAKANLVEYVAFLNETIKAFDRVQK